MDYLKFTRAHPAFFSFLMLLGISFPLFFIFSLYELDLDILMASLVGFIISWVLALLGGVWMVYYFKSQHTSLFVKHLGPLVLKKSFFSGENLITTQDFQPLKIIDFKPMSTFATSSKSYFVSGPWRRLDNLSEHFMVKGIDIYKKSYEGNFSIEFFLDKKEVTIKIPEFDYFSSLSDAWHDFKGWRTRYYEYPTLQKIIEQLPSWIKRAEVFSQGDTISVALLADREFCVHHSLETYLSLIHI